MTRIAKSSLLLFFFSLCATAIFVTHDLRSRTPPPLPRELYSVVSNQLAAFRASDFSRAYRNASSGVQQKFSLSQFENMIRRNYAEMLQSHRVEFGFIQVQGASALVQVFFFGEDGSVQSFLYSLVGEDETWKIEDVEPGRVSRPRQHMTGLHV
jgi:hypothetical protein